MAGTFDIICQLNIGLAGGSGELFQSLLAQTTTPSLFESINAQVLLWGRVALGIGFVIFVHELGHFLAAKFCGVKVEKFYVGFDVPIKIGPLKLPRALFKFRRGETEYGIGTIPLGGYVKMLGQDDDPRKAEAEAQRIRQEGGEVSGTLDPRSYPAKAVWQRMIIISAGVVMNLITGVLYAACAYLYGVPYMPAVVGNVTPGGPAYRAGIEPGGNVVTISDIVSDDNLYFSEMKNAILSKGMAAPDEEIDVEIAYPDGKRTYKLKTIPHPFAPEMRMIGIETPSSLTLAGHMSPNSVADAVIGNQFAGAQVIAVNGQTLPGSGATDDIQAQMAFRKQMQDHAGDAVTFTLQKSDGSKQDVELPAANLKLPGVHFSVGPVKAVVRGGVAENAGIKVGDQLVAVDGNRELDAFALPEQLSQVTDPVKMTFVRSSGAPATDGSKSEEIEVTLTPAAKPHAYSAINELDNTAALKQFDFAYEALPTISSVITENGASEGLQAGDILRSMKSDWKAPELADARSSQVMKAIEKKLNDGYELSAEEPLALVIDTLQWLPEGTEFSVMALRNGKVVEGKVKLVATKLPWDQRGLAFLPMERIHVASGFGEAMSLGLRESGRRLGDVWRFLQMLVTGRVAAKNIGGPITIFQVAGIESSQGVSRLLMFLTMLSMNLAILNFLPIPALDGGHMVFLIAEAVLGRPVDENLQMKLTFAGVLALLSLMAFALFNDVSRLLS